VAQPQHGRDARSPFRVYSDAILRRTLEQLASQPVEVIDVGCGSGIYAQMFKDSPGVYHGVDIVSHPDWPVMENQSARSPRRVVFHESPAEMLARLGLRTDFSFSCSALEHVDHPEAVVRALATCTLPGGYGLHITPAPWSLLLYGPHGWRRFSSASLTTLFCGAGFEVLRVYRLGGVPSLMLHLTWITGIESGRLVDFTLGSHLPSLMSRAFARVRYQRARTGRVVGLIYAALLRMAMWLDRFFPRMPVGYAILVRRRDEIAA
jgi:SAM-dependent methyltransferase